MSRLEENEMVVKEMTKRAANKPIGTYEETVTFQLGVIATMLADISKSLAIFADRTESEDENDIWNKNQEGSEDRITSS